MNVVTAIPVTADTDQIDIFALPVHPAADEFPMLRRDELQVLAADIQANGLRHPLLIGNIKLDGADDAEWMLIDGRNRREACRIAGVEPAVEYLNGEDPVKRIWSENAPRRHMNKGALAMVAACIYPEPAERGRGKKALIVKDFPGINQGSLSQARTVRALAPDLVPEVKAGEVSLADAYKTAQERKKARERKEKGLQQLRELAPDLADRVEDEADKLTLTEAFAILMDRDKEARAVRDSVFMGLADFYRNAKSFAAGEIYREIPAWLKVEAYHDELKRYFKGGVPELIEQAKCLREGVETIERIIEQLSTTGEPDEC